VIEEAGATAGCEKSKGVLLYTIANKFPGQAIAHRPMLVRYVMDGRIDMGPKLDAALAFLKKTGSHELDTAAFEDAAGVGVAVTEADIRAAVAGAVDSIRTELVEKRYLINTNILLGTVTAKLRFAEGAKVRAEMEAQVLALLGPKTEADEEAIKAERAKPKPKKEKKGGKDDKKEEKAEAAGAAKAGAASAVNAEAPKEREADVFAFLPKPAENNNVHTTVNFSDGKVMRIANSPAELEAHLKRTGGKHMTRFPPEPNGYLHIGHAKAMYIDFGMSARYGGDCILRFDDTNPEAEKQEFIDHIQDIVAWMGWKPVKITHASHYFPQLHALAVKLIELGLAYVCHQSGDEIAASREAREPSPWRDTPVEVNLRKFEDMRRGMYAEGEVSLRMKMDVKNENYNMFDLVAYRIKYVEHPMAGDKWCIYPSYDFTHCINDSLEDITHSLCTLEFEPRRASYYWLLEVLGLYKPVVYEYSKLVITHIQLSKRKLQVLVQKGIVDSWTDPRLPTLGGMRRLGFTPRGINNFCDEMGFARNESIAHLSKLEHFVRQDLDQIAPRRFGIVDPIKLVLTNVPADFQQDVDALVFPGRKEETSTYRMPLTKELWIEASDFREKDEKGYFGLAPGKQGMLRYAFAVQCTGFKADKDGRVTEVHAEALLDYAGKPPKGVIHWVSVKHALPAEIRLYDVLFKTPVVASLGDRWLEDINPESRVVKQGYVCDALRGAKALDKFQFERVGYFCVDEDTERLGKLVLNRTITLKDSRK